MAGLPWVKLFQGAAAASFLASFCAFCGNLVHLGFVKQPAGFLSIVAFMVFSVFMLATDLPHNGNEWQSYLYEIQYRFGLFTTRFTGRGIWYMFLGSLSVITNYNESGTQPQTMIGVVTGLYLTGLGMYTLNKGCALTNRLNRVRENMQRLGDSSDAHFVPSKKGGVKPMTVEHFRALFEQHDPRPHTDYEIEYMLNAISGKAFHDNLLAIEEVDTWLASSSKFMYLV